MSVQSTSQPQEQSSLHSNYSFQTIDNALDLPPTLHRIDENISRISGNGMNTWKAEDFCRLESKLDQLINQTHNTDRNYERDFPVAAYHDTNQIDPNPMSDRNNPEPSRYNNLWPQFARAILQKSIPEKFSGTEESNPVKFIREIQNLSKSYELSASQLKTVLASILEGPAARWFRAHAPFLHSIEHIILELKHEFVSPQYEHLIEMQIQHAKQTNNESACTYIYRLMELYDKLPTDVSDAEIIKQASFGFLRHISLHVGGKQYHTIGELIAEAKRIDMHFQPKQIKATTHIEPIVNDMINTSSEEKSPKPTTHQWSVPIHANEYVTNSTCTSPIPAPPPFPLHSTPMNQQQIPYVQRPPLLPTPRNLPSTLNTAAVPFIPHNRLCYRCGSPNHLANRCPQQQQQGNGMSGGATAANYQH